MKRKSDSVIPAIFRGATEADRVVGNVFVTENFATFTEAAKHGFGAAILGAEQTFAQAGNVEIAVLDDLRRYMDAGVFPDVFEGRFAADGQFITTNFRAEFGPLRDMFERMARVHFAITGLPYVYGRVGRNLRQEDHAHPYAITHIAMDTKQGLGFYRSDGHTLYSPPNQLFHFNGTRHESPNSANKISIAVHASDSYQHQSY